MASGQCLRKDLLVQAWWTHCVEEGSTLLGLPGAAPEGHVGAWHKSGPPWVLRCTTHVVYLAFLGWLDTFAPVLRDSYDKVGFMRMFHTVVPWTGSTTLTVDGVRYKGLVFLEPAEYRKHLKG